MPDGETMQALVAGLIAGSAGGLATTAIMLVALSRDRRSIALVSGLRVSLPLLGIVIVNGMMLAWTAVGLVLGALFLRAESTRPGGWPGGDNLMFTLLVTGTIAVAYAAATYVRGRTSWPVSATAATAALTLGWLLPALAA
jgi:hypothetical protein